MQIVRFFLVVYPCIGEGPCCEGFLTTLMYLLMLICSELHCALMKRFETTGGSDFMQWHLFEEGAVGSRLPENSVYPYRG